MNEFNKFGLIYVLPEYQRKGIGQKLWAAVIPFLDNGKDIIVQVATYNAKAISFYEKPGFADTGKRINDEKWKMKVVQLFPKWKCV